MKYFVILLSFLMVCCGSSKYTPATVIRDCSGSYLRIDSLDYQVCNYKILEARENQEKIKVKYKSIIHCPPEEGVVRCMMYHENQGWIEVEKVK